MYLNLHSFYKTGQKSSTSAFTIYRKRFVSHNQQGKFIYRQTYDCNLLYIGREYTRFAMEKGICHNFMNFK